MINAGDGKHEHPTQALLDVFTLSQKLGTLDGLNDLDRRRCPALQGRAVEHPRLPADGRERHRLRPADADPARDRGARLCRDRRRSSDLGEADVVYVLRMQNERMRDAYVPSLREYAQRYQIGLPRLRPGQLLMHPGPVNRGVELSADAIDSEIALIGEQVKSGVAVRMAVLYELLAGSATLAAVAS